VRNNMVFAGLAGFDCGICLHQARGATAAHNTVFTTTAPDSSSIEWRWPNTQVDVVNNLVSHDILDRGGSATLAGNIEGASASLFVDPVSGDLHLLPSARTAIDTGAPLDPGVCDDDFDGQARGALRDVGADEVRE
jgi:hypothetical protein